MNFKETWWGDYSGGYLQIIKFWSRWVKGQGEYQQLYGREGLNTQEVLKSCPTCFSWVRKRGMGSAGILKSNIEESLVSERLSDCQGSFTLPSLTVETQLCRHDRGTSDEFCRQDGGG